MSLTSSAPAVGFFTTSVTWEAQKLPCDLAISFLSVKPKKLKIDIQTNIWIPMFTGGLLTIAKSHPSFYQ